MAEDSPPQRRISSASGPRHYRPFPAERKLGSDARTFCQGTCRYSHGRGSRGDGWPRARRLDPLHSQIEGATGPEMPRRYYLIRYENLARRMGLGTRQRAVRILPNASRVRRTFLRNRSRDCRTARRQNDCKQSRSGLFRRQPPQRSEPRRYRSEDSQTSLAIQSTTAQLETTLPMERRGPDRSHGNGRATIAVLGINLPHRTQHREQLIVEGVFPEEV